MKIVHIAECAGGVERYLQMIIPLLDEKGISQTLICSQHFTIQKFDKIVENFYQLKIRRSLFPIFIIKNILSIRVILKKIHPDLIYCHSSFGGVLGRLASIGIKTKVIYNPHGWSFNVQNISNRKKNLYVMFERLLDRLTDKYIAISEFEKNQALHYHICTSEKIKVIRNGLEISKYQHRKERTRKELGIPEDSVVIGMVGRLTIGKSPDVFVKMASILKKKIPKSFFVIVGDGENKEKVKLLINKLKMSDSFLITGWIDNAYDYEKVFDIAVLLTRWEGFGLAVAEYMICRKPIVSTRIGGIMDIVTDGFNGLLINEIDERSAASAVFKLYNDESLANKLANNAYNFALKELNITRTAAEHYSLFKSLQNHVQ